MAASPADPFANSSLAGIVLSSAMPAPAAPAGGGSSTVQGTDFTYQGHLSQSGRGVTAQCDFMFSLYGVPVGGLPVGRTHVIIASPVTVDNGLFTVSLDFGDVFNGLERWLDISVRCPAGIGAYTTMTTRQALTINPAVHLKSGAPGASGFNPLQIAEKRWYQASMNGVSYPTGSFPVSLAFDGQFIWSANEFGNNVTKINAADGTTVSFPAGSAPAGILYDGASIWVSNYISTGTVTRLKPSTGAIIGTYPSGGTNPTLMAFDGVNVWVVNKTGGVTRLKANDGSNQGNFPTSTNSYGIAFDGANMWITNRNTSPGTETKLRASDGTNLGSFQVGKSPYEVAFDGANIWVANNGDGTVTELRASDGANLGTFPANASPIGLVFDGVNLWVSNFVSTGTITEIRPADGVILGSWGVGNAPAGLAFDGAFIWVANSGSDDISKR